MTLIIRFMIVFTFVYLLVSLPAMLGFGYVIDWIDEATIMQKFKANIVGGLAENFLVKVLISSVTGLVALIKRR